MPCQTHSFGCTPSDGPLRRCGCRGCPHLGPCVRVSRSDDEMVSVSGSLRVVPEGSFDSVGWWLAKPLPYLFGTTQVSPLIPSSSPTTPASIATARTISELTPPRDCTMCLAYNLSATTAPTGPHSGKGSLIIGDTATITIWAYLRFESRIIPSGARDNRSSAGSS
jgi:hypothetical protein